VDGFGATFSTLGELALTGATVSASVVDVDSGRLLVAIDDRVSLPTASVGKVLLLIEVAARVAARSSGGLDLLERPREVVGDSGVWQHLQVPALPVSDLARLVGAVSDNLATNALLRLVGLDAVRERAESLGLRRTALLDRVRDERGPDDAPQLSVGSAAELAALFAALARGAVVDPVVSGLVLDWLSSGTDLSMVASAFGFDPLAHREEDHGLSLVNKTGADVGVRAEAGVLRGPSGAVGYAVLVRFDDVSTSARLRVLDAMRRVGVDLLEYAG